MNAKGRAKSPPFFVMGRTLTEVRGFAQIWADPIA